MKISFCVMVFLLCGVHLKSFLGYCTPAVGDIVPNLVNNFVCFCVVFYNYCIVLGYVMTALITELLVS